MIQGVQATGIGELLAAAAARAPDALALGAPGAVWLTRASLHRQMESIGVALRARGIRGQDRVAIALPSGPDMAVACFGVAFGAVSAPLNHAYRRSELEFYLADLNAKAVIVQAGVDSAAREAARARGIQVLELRPAEEEIVGLPKDGLGDPPPGGGRGAKDVALVLHTSGTTSRPKIVPLTHGNLCASARFMGRSLGLSEADRCLNVSPLFHIHGLMVTLASLLAGGGVVCPARFDVDQFFVWLEEYRPSWYTAVPTVHQAIVARVAEHAGIVSRSQLRFIRSSSAPLPTRVRSELERAFRAPAIESYGMTEATLQITCEPLPPRERKVGSVGVAAGPEVRILDETGEEALPGAVGEIVIRGESVIRGYENDAGGGAFVDGWLRTGDQGYLDGDGYLFITGRLKDIINRGGQKISPREVDEVLMDHPAIAQAVTFPMPHATLGEDVVAAVVLRPGATASKGDIRRFAAERLAAFKTPRHVLMVSSIPTGPTGKWQRRAMAEVLGLVDARGEVTPRAAFAPPMDPLEFQLAQIWEQLFGVTSIGVEDDFFDLGGNSLLAARMLDEVERVCGWTIAPSVLFGGATIAHLARELLARRSASSAGPSIVRIRPGGSRPPFVFLNGDYNGGGFYCRGLAARLHPEQPFYALPPHGSNGDPVPPTIEAMAEDYVETLRGMQPRGPYLLGGFSHAGLIAFEMAQRLRARGERVSLLVVIDKAAAHPGWRVLRGLVEGLGRAGGLGVKQRRDAFLLWRYRLLRLRRLSGLRWDEQISYALRKAGFGGAQLPTLAPIGASAPSETVGRRQLPLIDLYDDIVTAYAPRRYPGRVTLVRSAEGPVRQSSDPTLGWGRVAGQVQVLSVPGDHMTCITKHADALAQHLRVCLDEAQG